MGHHPHFIRDSIYHVDGVAEALILLALTYLGTKVHPRT